MATAIRNLDEEIDLRVTLHREQQHGVQALADIEIPNRRGQLIPLPKTAEWTTTSGISVYEHEDNQRQVTVMAEIDSRVTDSLKVNKLMREKTKAIADQHPELSFHFGGEDRDTKESMESLKTTFIFALLWHYFSAYVTVQKLISALHYCHDDSAGNFGNDFYFLCAWHDANVFWQ